MMQKILISDLKCAARIGIHPHEYEAPQDVLISLIAEIEKPPLTATIKDIVCYETLVNQIIEIIKRQHYDLVEQLSDKIADHLLQDKRITTLKLCIEKPDAIAQARAVGVETNYRQTR